MIKAIRDNVVVKPFLSDEISSGGIYLSEAHREISNKMRVVSIGNRVTRFQEGETVFRIRDCGDEVLIDGEKHFIVKESWLIAKLN